MLFQRCVSARLRDKIPILDNIRTNFTSNYLNKSAEQLCSK